MISSDCGVNRLNVVLYQPEIPQNAGNIARLCACTNSNLILIGKLGFSLTNAHLKRSGLDYWDKVNIIKYVSFDEFLNNVPPVPNSAQLHFFTTKATKLYTDAVFKKGDYLIFGSESKGLPDDIMNFAPQAHIKLPMATDTRSLNLSNTVAVGVYEAIRQILW